MNVLDESIIKPERDRLQSWRIHFRFIGKDVGSYGMEDRQGIIPLLHRLRRPTFFTRDQDFHKLKLLHAGYCLVYLDVGPDETAEFIRRVLRHSAFRTQVLRMGKVLHVRHSGVSWWELRSRVECALSW